jgi:hypothetical protein
MLPGELTPSSFAKYPPEARNFAVSNLAVLQQMPLPLVIILLREVIGYDWRFPAERATLDGQFAWLRSLSADDSRHAADGFNRLTLSPQVTALDWVERPQQASEDLSAYLWSSHQMDAFHQVAGAFAESMQKVMPEQAPETPRLGMIVFGQGVKSADYPLFRKLRPHGVYFPNVAASADMQPFQDMLAARLARNPQPYQHWLIDGEAAEPLTSLDHRIAHISWSETGTLRSAILARMQQVIHSAQGGPEQLRTLLATTTPADVGLASAKDEVLSRYKLTLLTEGSGTQIFSTTFAQWAAREALRRAQPSTILVRFGPRQRQLPMDELVAGVSNAVADAAGSLVDADIGAFYTWINQQRLSGAEQSKFIAWSQEHKQAVVLGAGLPRGTTAAGSMTLHQLLAL